jgi:hypothetical protein
MGQGGARSAKVPGALRIQASAIRIVIRRGATPAQIPEFAALAAVKANADGIYAFSV